MGWYSSDTGIAKDGYLSDLLTEEIKNVDFRDDFVAEFRENKPKELVSIPSIGKQELLLGCVDKDYNQVVTSPFNGKSSLSVIVGGKGSGKTQFGKFMATQVHDRFGFNVFFIDPKNDYSNLHEPQSVPKYVEILKRHGIQPRGYDAVYYKPAYFNMDDKKGTEFLITPRDFLSLDWGKRQESIKEMFGVEQGSAAERALDSFLALGIPLSIEGWKRNLKKVRSNELKLRKELGNPNTMVSTSIDSALKRLIDQGIFGEEGQKLTIEANEDGRPTKTKTVHAAYFPQDLASSSHDNMVVLQVDLIDLKRTYISSVIIKIAVASLWSNRKSFVDSNGRQGVLNRPTLLYLDEGDVIIPRKGDLPSKDQVHQLFRRGRQHGWSGIALTQQPYQFSEEMFDHADYIYTPRINDEMASILTKKFNVNDMVLNELYNLQYDTNDKPPQWAQISKNTDDCLRIFYPFPPTVQIKTECM